MRRAIYTFGLTAAFAVLLAGCGGGDGPKLVEASGTIMYDGKPLEDASIVFQPDGGPVSTGRTDSEGKFTLSTKGKPGAPVGSGPVAVTAVEMLTDETDESKMSDEEVANMSRWLIPEHFGNVKTSGLKATVPAEGTTDLHFELEKSAKKKRR